MTPSGLEPELVDALAREAGVQVLRLDPLGHPAVPGYDSYHAMLESNLQTLVQGQSLEAGTPEAQAP